MKRAVVILRNIILAAITMFFVWPQAMQASTNYVTLIDGRLLVFPDSCLKSSVIDNTCVTFTALDGTVYSYSSEEIQSIGKRLPKSLPSFASYKFNNKYNYQVISDATGVINNNEINVEVAGIGKWLTASFTLSDETARAYVDGVEQKSKTSRLRFDPSRAYTVGYPGDVILSPLSSGDYGFMPYGRQYIVTVDYLTDHSTMVPRIDINTKDSVNITSRKVYVDAEIIIDGAGVFPSMTDSVQIKGRGNNSWSSDPNSKNPYRLKFAEKVKPLGLTKGKNWVLLANKLKGSMLTNAIGMKAASLMGTEAANHIIPVDLYLNGKYKGSYNFTEKVGFSNNSVDLDDEIAAALLELDKYYDEATTQKFKSTPYKLPVNIKEPEFDEDPTLLTLNIIKERFNAFAAAVENNENITGEADVDHLARYFMLNEYICNLELYWPKSTYCYYEDALDPESKLKFGPVWDLDWAFGYDGSYSSSYFNRNVTFDYFHNSSLASTSINTFIMNIGDYPSVTLQMYLVWKEFMENGLDELCDFCQDYYDYAKPSFQKNKAARLDTYNYDDQIDMAIEWLRQRADFIFQRLRQKYELHGDVNMDGEVNIGDVGALMDIILGGYTNAEITSRADVNGDGEITVSDVNSLVIIIMGI